MGKSHQPAYGAEHGDRTDLPPVEVLLVKDLQNVSAAEAEACLLAGNQVVVGRVVIKVTLHKSLKWIKMFTHVKETEQTHLKGSRSVSWSNRTLLRSLVWCV